jgi:hypothetical protein
MPPRPPDARAHPMAVGHGPQQDGSWPMEDRTAGASLGSLPGVKPSADRGCRETDATLVNRDSPFVVAATTMWEIETNGVGNGVAGSPVATGWTCSVDSPPWVVDRTGGYLSTEPLSNQPRCPNVRELANCLPVQGREYVRNAPQTPRVALDRPKDATRQDGSID